MKLETLYVDNTGIIKIYNDIKIRKYFSSSPTLRTVIFKIHDHNTALELSNYNYVNFHLSVETMHDIISLKSCIKFGEWFFTDYSLMTFMGELK